MRDGMPVVALVVAVIALVVAFSGLVSRGTSEPGDAPEEAIEKAERRLVAVEGQRRRMREEMAEIAAQATRAIELGSGSGGASIDPAELEKSVGKAVGAAMRTKLREEAKRVGAPPPKMTAQEKFDGMLKDLDKSITLAKPKSEALHNTLVRLRANLNTAFNTYKGKGKNAERDREARLARSKSDASLRRVLSPAEFDRFAKWRKSTKNDYAKKFFGH
jgi:hypothetical protein